MLALLPKTDVSLCEKLFDEYDADRSGDISYLEFARHSIREQLSQQKNRVNDLFRLWDVDSSGTIDKDEFLHAIETMGYDCPRDAAYALFDDIDEDKSGEVEYKELNKWLRRTRRYDAPPDPDAPPRPPPLHVGRERVARSRTMDESALRTAQLMGSVPSSWQQPATRPRMPVLRSSSRPPSDEDDSGDDEHLDTTYLHQQRVATGQLRQMPASPPPSLATAPHDDSFGACRHASGPAQPHRHAWEVGGAPSCCNGPGRAQSATMPAEHERATELRRRRAEAEARARQQQELEERRRLEVQRRRQSLAELRRRQASRLRPPAMQLGTSVSLSTLHSCVIQRRSQSKASPAALQRDLEWFHQKVASGELLKPPEKSARGLAASRARSAVYFAPTTSLRPHSSHGASAPALGLPARPRTAG